MTTAVEPIYFVKHIEGTFSIATPQPTVITDLDKVKQLPLSDEAAHAIYEAWYDDNESGVDLVRRVEAAYGIGDV